AIARAEHCRLRARAALLHSQRRISDAAAHESEIEFSNNDLDAAMASALGGLGFGDFDGRPDRYADFARPQDIASIQFESAHQRTFIDKLGVGHRLESRRGRTLCFGAGDAVSEVRTTRVSGGSQQMP